MVLSKFCILDLGCMSNANITIFARIRVGLQAEFSIKIKKDTVTTDPGISDKRLR